MRAWTYDSFGDLDHLRLTEQPDPLPGPGTVRVQVRAAAVNPVDWKILAGGLGDRVPVHFPATIGWDVAGVVDELGFDVDDVSIGDGVLADAMQDVVWRGTMAEYAIIPVRAIARKPDSLGWDDAAALPLAGQTALQAVRRLGVTRGETLLVHNASGGVGSFAVQIAAHLGARVIGTASPHNHELVRADGGEPVAYGDSLVDAVRALAPEGVDAVFDAVGGVLEQSQAVLAEGGRLLSIADPGFVQAGGQWAWVRPRSTDTEELAHLAAEGAVRPRLAGVHPFAEADAAYRQSQEGHAAGKVVVHVSDD